MSSNLSRRTVLTAAAASALPGLTVPALAAVDIERDPIFAAIEKHRAAIDVMLMKSEQEEDVVKALPADRCRSNSFSQVVETDDPRWTAAVREYDEAHNAMEEAGVAVLDVQPKTVSGAAALLRHAADNFDANDGVLLGWPEKLLPDGVDAAAARWNTPRSPEYFIIRNVGRALERLTGREGVQV